MCARAHFMRTRTNSPVSSKKQVSSEHGVSPLRIWYLFVCKSVLGFCLRVVHTHKYTKKISIKQFINCVANVWICCLPSHERSTARTQARSRRFWRRLPVVRSPLNALENEHSRTYAAAVAAAATFDKMHRMCVRDRQAIRLLRRNKLPYDCDRKIWVRFLLKSNNIHIPFVVWHRLAQYRMR